jgi:hypothetical protein
MCQLTLLDIDPKLKLGKVSIRNLTELNQTAIQKYSPQTNEDGFGYMTFSKAPEIIKTGKSAISWWNKNWETYQKSVRNPNGIYHVRAASNNIKTIFEEDAHPFYHGHIIVAHNGTMTEDDKLENDEELQKLFEVVDPKEPMIDSEKFCKLLSHICGKDKLEKEHIVLTMEYFHGPFALLIYDTKQPKKLFVARGKDRPLHMAEVYSGKRRGERIGLVLNTHLYELMFWSKMVKSVAKEFHNMNLHIGITSLQEESIYEYNIGSYDIGEIVGEIKQTSPPVKIVKRSYPPRNVNSYPRNQTHNHHNDYMGVSEHSDNAKRFSQFYDLCSDTGIGLAELFIMAEYTLGVALHVATEDQLEYLRNIMIRLTKFDYKGRRKVWKEFLKTNEINTIAGYKYTEISFPYLLMSKKLIKSKGKKVKLPVEKPH